MKGKTTSKEVIIKVLEMREKGSTTGQISEKLGISGQTVRNIEKRYKFFDGPGSEKMEKKVLVEIEQPAAPAAKAVPPVPSQVRNGTVANPPAAPTDKLSVLKSISSRALIKELYTRGYRLEKEGLFVIEKKKVMLNDILNQA